MRGRGRDPGPGGAGGPRVPGEKQGLGASLALPRQAVTSGEARTSLCTSLSGKTVSKPLPCSSRCGKERQSDSWSLQRVNHSPLLRRGRVCGLVPGAAACPVRAGVKTGLTCSLWQRPEDQRALLA